MERVSDPFDWGPGVRFFRITEGEYAGWTRIMFRYSRKWRGRKFVWWA